MTPSPHRRGSSDPGQVGAGGNTGSHFAFGVDAWRLPPSAGFLPDPWRPGFEGVGQSLGPIVPGEGPTPEQRSTLGPGLRRGTAEIRGRRTTPCRFGFAGRPPLPGEDHQLRQVATKGRLADILWRQTRPMPDAFEGGDDASVAAIHIGYLLAGPRPGHRRLRRERAAASAAMARACAMAGAPA
jgi:hypothetical protein